MVLKLPCNSLYYFELIICMIIIHAWSIHFMQAYTLAGLSGGFLTFFISMSMLLGRFVSSINRKQWSQQSPRWANSTVLIDSPSTIFHVINVIQSKTIVSSLQYKSIFWLLTSICHNTCTLRFILIQYFSIKTLWVRYSLDIEKMVTSVAHCIFWPLICLYQISDISCSFNVNFGPLDQSSNRIPMLTPNPTMTICLLQDLAWISLIETNNVQVVGCICAAYDPMSPLLSLLWRIPYPVPDWKDGHDGISSKTIWLVCYSWFQLTISSSTCVIQNFCENSWISYLH
jgi:biotin transporter BioY